MSEQTAAQADDFAAVLAEVSGEAPPEAEAVQDADTADESGAEAAPDEPETDEAPADEPEPLTEAEAAAAKLIESGDLDGALKRLGVDPKLVKIDRRQFFAMRKGLADAKAKTAEAERTKAEAAKLKTEAEKLYGPIAAGFRAKQAGDGAKLRAAIELLAEDSFENVLAIVQRANKPLDPATAEVLRLRSELQQRDAKQKEAETAAQARAAEAAQLTKLEAQVAKTPLAKVPGAAKQIYERVKASYDGVGYSLSVKEAYAQVKAEAEAVAEAFGIKPVKSPAKPGTRPLPERRPGSGGARLTKEEAEAAEFARTIREAEAAAKQAVRAVKRGTR